MERLTTVQNENWEGLCAFCRRSSYDLIQIHTECGWGTCWTFESDSPAAAEKAGEMLKTMYGTSTRLRHVHKTRLPELAGNIPVAVIVTELPGRAQVVLDLETAERLSLNRIYVDEALNALAGTLGSGGRPVMNWPAP